MPPISLSIDDVNKLPSEKFIKIFGNVVEHYSSAAIGILKCRPFENADHISDAIDDYLDLLSDTERIKILQRHPDLAGKLAEQGSLTNESEAEQKSAGLDVITQENKIKLNKLNEAYKKKFDFPFVICARENKVPTILSSIENRLGNDKDTELSISIQEVKKISRLRIFDMVKK